MDIGGADGLVHISEMSWTRVRAPEDVLKVGDERDFYVLRVDRDAKRIADLDAIKTSLNLYMAQATGTPNLSGDAGGSENAKCLNGSGTDNFWVNTTGAITAPTGGTPAWSSATTSNSITQTVGSSGWIPARLDQTPGGSPLANLPLDPTNGTGNSTLYYYGYACETPAKTIEITARLESTYFLTDLNMDGTDGGDSAATYEVGSDLTILPNGF